MRKIMKNLLLIIVMAIICLAMSTTVSALAETGQCGEDVYWNYNSETGQLVISGTGPMRDDYVWSTSPFSETDIKTVIVQEGVTYIGDYAFFDCDSLTSVEIPDSVTSIGDYAFSYCTSLTSIEIPASVTSIGSGAFQVSGEVLVDENNLYYSSDEYGAFFNKEKTQLISFPFNTENEIYEIPSTVKAIEQAAFFMNVNLKEVIVPEGVKEIGDGAFSDCFFIEKIELPSSLEKIGYIAFHSCVLLNDVTLPENLVEIGESAFTYCESLTNVTVLCANVEIVDGAIGYATVNRDDVFAEYVELSKKIYKGLGDEGDYEKIEELESQLTYYDTPKPLVTFYRHDDDKNYTIDTYAEKNGFELVRTHFYDEWITTVEPTCTEFGKEKRECGICDYYETNILEANGHTEETLPAVSATCTSTGLTDGIKCLACGEILVEQTITEMLPHSMEEWVTIQEPTCTEQGEEKRKCANCDYYEMNTLNATGHTDSTWITDSNPTCKKQGLKHIECTVCEEVLKTESIPVIPHSYSAVVTAPTCISGGYTTYTCACGDMYIADETPATEHNYKNGVCTECGDSKVDSCSCNCHKSGFMGFIWKIINFFNKLFKSNKFCDCGIAHY